jgi:CheY-like chemotaxis protein
MLYPTKMETLDVLRLAVYLEDNVDSIMLMELLFPLEGMALRSFSNSEAFMEKILALPVVPELFMLDIHVPPLSGFEVLKLLREHPKYKDVPVIALTASVMNEEVSRLRAAGFSGVLPKPVDVNSFADYVRRIRGGEVIWGVNL